MKTVDAKYCPRCGKRVKESQKLTWEKNEEEMRDAAAPTGKETDRCVVFSGIYEMNAEETIDISEIGKALLPDAAEVYYHE